MISPNLESMVPGLREQRAHEALTRALAFSGIGPTVCGISVEHITPRDRIRLRLLKNAYMIESLAPLKGDAYAILCLMSQKMRSCRFIGKWREKRRIARVVREKGLDWLSSGIRAYLSDAFQDSPEAFGDERKKMVDGRSDHVLPLAAECEFFMTEFHMCVDEFMSTPYLVLQQLHRAYRLNNPDDPGFVNKSDRMIGQMVNDLTKKTKKNRG